MYGGGGGGGTANTGDYGGTINTRIFCIELYTCRILEVKQCQLL